MPVSISQSYQWEACKLLANEHQAFFADISLTSPKPHIAISVSDMLSSSCMFCISDSVSADLFISRNKNFHCNVGGHDSHMAMLLGGEISCNNLQTLFPKPLIQ